MDNESSWEKNQRDSSKDRLQIYTLGQFLIKRGNRIISENSRRTSKQWELLKCLLSRHGKGLLPETILDMLWPDMEYTDPKRAVRTMVCRLRNFLDEELPDPKDSYINLSHGCYRWNTQLDYWMDAEEFERLCLEAQSLANTDPLEAIPVYLEALSLYKGDFLPESSFQDWVLPVRNYYCRIYLNSVLELIELLKEHGNYSMVMKVSENALLIEPYEEEFHIRFIEALLELEKVKQARAHYEYVTASFYRDLGVKPSEALRRLYQKINLNEQNHDLDLQAVQEKFKELEEVEGAFYCDADFFRLLYRLEGRRIQRTDRPVLLGLLSFSGLPLNMSRTELKEAMESLKCSIQKCLRQGDVYCQWNEMQYLLMLPGLDIKSAGKVLKRIQVKFNKQGPRKGIKLTSQVQALLPFSCSSS